MKDFMELLVPWREWQEWFFVAVVIAAVFAVYYGGLSPVIGRLYLHQFKEYSTRIQQDTAAHGQDGEKKDEVTVEIRYFPYVASFASSEAWITIYHSPREAGTVYFVEADDYKPQSQGTTTRSQSALMQWGCGLKESSWFCVAHPPRLQLSYSRLDTYEIRYTLFPLHFSWWRKPAIAQFALINSAGQVVTLGTWAALHYDPWRVFWWQVVYKNLLFPPWSNVALLLLAFVIAYAGTEHIVPSLHRGRPSGGPRKWQEKVKDASKTPLGHFVYMGGVIIVVFVLILWLPDWAGCGVFLAFVLGVGKWLIPSISRLKAGRDEKETRQKETKEMVLFLLGRPQWYSRPTAGSATKKKNVRTDKRWIG